MEKEKRKAMSNFPAEGGVTQEYLVNGVRVRLNFLPKGTENSVMAEIRKTLLDSVDPDTLRATLA